MGDRLQVIKSFVKRAALPLRVNGAGGEKASRPKNVKPGARKPTKTTHQTYLTDARQHATLRQSYCGNIRATLVFGGSAVATAAASWLSGDGNSTEAILTLTIMYALVVSLDKHCQRLAQAWGEVVGILHQAMIRPGENKELLSETPEFLMRYFYRKTTYKPDFFGRTLKIAAISLWGMFVWAFVKSDPMIYHIIQMAWLFYGTSASSDLNVFEHNTIDIGAFYL